MKSSRSSHAGAIAGGVVGGVVGISAAIAALFLWRRRRNHDSRVTFIREKFDGSDGGRMAVEPFLHQPSLYASTPGASSAHSQTLLVAASDGAVPINATSPVGLPTPPLVTVGHPSKLQRMNAPYQDPSAPSSSASHPARALSSTGESSSAHGVETEAAPDLAEIPNLVRRLNNLLQGRHEELPPQYES